MINVEIGVTLALSFFTCMLNKVAANVSGMKKKAISVNLVMCLGLRNTSLTFYKRHCG